MQLPDVADRRLSFRHDKDLNRVIVEVTDAETREVVQRSSAERGGLPVEEPLR